MSRTPTLSDYVTLREVLDSVGPSHALQMVGVLLVERAEFRQQSAPDQEGAAMALAKAAQACSAHSRALHKARQ